MRLHILDSGQRLPHRIFLRMIGLAMRGDAPDVVKLHVYRPRYFGLEFGDRVHALMRGPSPWSVGERELFAAYTSRLNQCPF
jgi:hypothetical protein